MRVFRISGYKNEREGNKLAPNPSSPSSNDFFEHLEMAKEISGLLRVHGLAETDIINITAIPTLHRDRGSWDFWIFVRSS